MPHLQHHLVPRALARQLHHAGAARRPNTHAPHAANTHAPTCSTTPCPAPLPGSSTTLVLHANLRWHAPATCKERDKGLALRVGLTYK